MVQGRPDAARHFLILAAGGRLRVRFRIDGTPAWAQLRLEHTATKVEDEHPCWIDVLVDGRLLREHLHPGRGGDVLDLTAVVHPGEHEVLIAVTRDSRSVYWLHRLEVRYGSGTPPPRD
jgi:hypothetical protein